MIPYKIESSGCVFEPMDDEVTYLHVKGHMRNE
uniref:Uncharacterized protein n=1 Tax=Lepeophtheirus salmonis TaxID=72036 RepID=A0A0K2VA90_LEPSM